MSVYSFIIIDLLKKMLPIKRNAGQPIGYPASVTVDNGQSLPHSTWITR